MNSLEMLKQITTYNETHLEPQYTAPDEMYEALKARLVNEHQVTLQLVHALKLVQCICIRQFKYHGKGVTMCFKCRAMVLYEMLAEGKSETQKQFERHKP